VICETRARVRAAGWKRRLAVAAIVGLVGVPAGWLGTDVLEQDDDFCNACHLEPGVPLHLEIRRNFDERPAASLAGLHAAAAHPTRPPAASEFRCIDCHGGVGLVGRARVKLLAAKDGFWWAVGHFDEPTEMAWPLRDEDCRQCHADFLEAAARAGDANPPFHALGVHNVALAATCVDCHLVHDPGGLEELYHLHPAQVRERCADCHTEFE